jgi:hypothetical protein
MLAQPSLAASLAVELIDAPTAAEAQAAVQAWFTTHPTATIHDVQFSLGNSGGGNPRYVVMVVYKPMGR